MQSLLIPSVLLITLSGLGISAAISQNPLESEQLTTRQSQKQHNLDEKDQNYISFFSKILLERNRTLVSIPFNYEKNTPILFLGFLPVQGYTNNERLISHPQINNLPWSLISQDGISLYQKNKTYDTIQSFLDNPPNPSLIASDPILSYDKPNLTGAQSLFAEIDLNQIEYIFTTYKPSELDNGVYYYETIFDATNAQLTDHNEISWYIKAPLASQDNTFLLGQINVEYLQ